MDTHTVDLPEVANDYAITQEQVARFQRDGHILLRRVAAPEEVAAYRPIIVGARDRFGQQPIRLQERDTYGKAFLKGMNLWAKDPGVHRFVLSRRFAKIAADLLGVDGVRIYHDQALVKEPGGGITPWHQDQQYWPLDSSNTVTMWMPLVDVVPEMGCIRFASGSHKEGSIGDIPISDDSEERLQEYVRSRNYPIDACPEMKAGDATFHYGWTVHGAPANNTGHPREVMTIIWFADGARVVQPDNLSRQRDLERWLPGLHTGDLAASDLNPLVYKR